MTPLATERFVCWCWGKTAASVRIVDVVFHMLVQLFKEEGSFQPHLGDCAVKSLDSEAGAVVVFFDVVDAPAEFDAFSVVGDFDGWGEVFLRICSVEWWHDSC